MLKDVLQICSKCAIGGELKKNDALNYKFKGKRTSLSSLSYNNIYCIVSLDTLHLGNGAF